MPGPSCSTCARTDLADVHRMVDTKGVSAAARHYGIKKPTLILHLKHRQKPAEPVPAPEPSPLPVEASAPVPPKAEPPPAPLAAEADLPLDDIEGRIRQLARTADRLRVAAEHGTLRDRGAALNACRAATAEAAELQAKRDQGREPDLLSSKAWQRVRRELVEALEAFPDAAAVVLQRLRAVEAA